MPQVALYDKSGEKIGQAELSDRVFAAPVNPVLLHQAVVTIEQQMRQDSARSLRRSEVDLTKTKWFRQKGTGRARHGARSAPIFVGGGVAHGPSGPRRIPRINRQMRRRALAGALSQKLHEGAVMLVDEVSLEQISTRAFAALLGGLGVTVGDRVLMVLGSDEARDEKVYKSSRNLPNLVVRETPHINARDVVWAAMIIFSQAGAAGLSEGVGANA